MTEVFHVLLTTVNHNLLNTGWRIAAFGFGASLLATLMSANWLKSSRSGNPYGYGRWNGFRIARVPLAIFGAVGLIIVLIAVL